MFVVPDRLGAVLDAGKPGPTVSKASMATLKFRNRCGQSLGVPMCLETLELIDESLTAAAHRICAQRLLIVNQLAH
jgi:hypothetical protein